MTVLQACVRVHGVHRGALVAAHVAQMALAAHDLGHFPSGSEYAEYWYVTDRTAWYHRSRSREVFGDDLEEVVANLADRLGDRRSPRAIAALNLPTLTTA